MESMFGQTEEDTKVIGKKIKCMEKEFILGLMDVNIMVIMKMIKNRDMVNTLGYIIYI